MGGGGSRTKKSGKRVGQSMNQTEDSNKIISTDEPGYDAPEAALAFQETLSTAALGGIERIREELGNSYNAAILTCGCGWFFRRLELPRARHTCAWW